MRGYSARKLNCKTCSSSLLLNGLDRLRARAAQGGDLAGRGALLRHIVQTRSRGWEALRQFHAMLWPSASDDWTDWLSSLCSAHQLVNRTTLMMDSWISGALAMRVAIHASWAADSGKLTNSSLREAMGRCLDVCLLYIQPMFEGRAAHRAPKGRAIELSNQMAGMLAGMLFTGQVFGWRLCADRRARDLFKYARDAFDAVVGALDPEGYQGEGPTYQLGVESPGLILCCELLDSVEGGDHFFKLYPHPSDPDAKASVAGLVETTLSRLYSGAGLCLPLDDYGPHHPQTAFPLVYAAFKTGRRAFIDMFEHRGPHGVGSFMWFADDLAWCMAFWPEGLGGKKWSGPGDFVLPKHLAMLEAGGGSSLLQLWDRCEPLPHTHAHVNPNSITVEAFDVPVLVEGSIPVRRMHFYGTPFQHSEPGMRSMPIHLEPFSDIFRFGEGDYRSAASRDIGAHNCVLVDGLDVAHPRWDAAGSMSRYASGPLASMVVSDCAPIYEAAGFDVLRATRSVLADKAHGIFLVSDEIATREPRAFTWQVYARGECRRIAGGVFCETREGVGLEIAAADGGGFEKYPMPNYPACFEGECTRLRRSLHGRVANFMHLLRPVRTRELVLDITDGWSAGYGESLGAAESGEGTALVESWRASMSRPAYLDNPRSLGRWVTYRRSFRAPRSLPGRRIFLHLPLPAGLAEHDAFALRVNGKAFDPVPARESHFSLLTFVRDITDAIRFGSTNEINVKLISSSNGGTRGKAFLSAAEPDAAFEPAKLSVARGCLSVKTRQGAVRYFPKATDADSSWLLGSAAGRQYGALFNVRSVRVGALKIRSDKRISLQWDDSSLWLIVPRGGCGVSANGRPVLEKMRQLDKFVEARALKVMVNQHAL